MNAAVLVGGSAGCRQERQQEQQVQQQQLQQQQDCRRQLRGSSFRSNAASTCAACARRHCCMLLRLRCQGGDEWMSAVVEPGTGSSRLLVAGSSGSLYSLDLLTNKLACQVGWDCLLTCVLQCCSRLRRCSANSDACSLLACSDAQRCAWAASNGNISGSNLAALLLLLLLTVQTPTASGDGLLLLRGPVGTRGTVAAATPGGRVLLLDTRTSWQVRQP